MKLSELSPEQITIDSRELIDRILFDGIEDNGQTGDIVFVFGSKQATRYRVPLAAELYKTGRAAKLLMSGGNRFESEEQPEAVIMKENAITLGVPEQDILIETRSTHTAENVVESKQVLEQTFGLQNIKRILVVSTTYHMRRCFLTLKTHMPGHIEYTLCPANDRSTRRDNWWQNEKGRARVIKEVQGLIRYTKTKQIMDWTLH